MSEKCKFCGAAVSGIDEYACGSAFNATHDHRRGAECHKHEIARLIDQLAQKARELEQSRQREAQALAVVARVGEWAVRWYGQHDPMTPLEVELDSILSDAPKVLAVVDGWAYDDVASDNLWTREGWAGITPEHDTDQQRPVRVIVLGRDESEG